MNRNTSDWTELGTVLLILFVSIGFISVIDPGADILRMAVLTAIFVLVVALTARRTHLV